MAKTRKTPDTWIAEGLKALPKSGPDVLRAETLARAIGTTKGSFYWHFKDVPDFHAKLLDHWKSAALDRFNTIVAEHDTAVAQLRALNAYRPNPTDRAVRAWSGHSKAAKKSVDAVDAAILEFLSELLSAMDATHPDFPGLVHATLMAAPKGGSHVETLVDLLLVLK
ncbi:MAG: TetR/AcrR family transcriptional regulator [Pseudomonadota bacterium]